jgi:hypothetical protein
LRCLKCEIFICQVLFINIIVYFGNKAYFINFY